MLIEKVQSLAHGKIEQTHAVCADQIQMRSEPMAVFEVQQFAIAEPLQVQRDNSVAGEIDASLLLVFHRFARRSYVAIHVQNGGALALDLLGFVQNPNGLKSGDDLVADFSNAVPRAGWNGTEVLRFQGRVDPFTRPAVKNYIVQHAAANSFRL